MSTMPSVESGTYSPGPNMVYSPEQEKVGTGRIEAITCPVYSDLRIRATVSKLAVHYTPKHGSWLNMAEIELSHLSRQYLGGRIAVKATLIHKVQAWNTQRNEKHAKAHWQFTTDDARVKLRRLYPIVST